MPGIDFNQLRAEITMEQVLALLDFDCVRRRAEQWYGYCPLHESKTKHRRAFSVNVAKGCYYCHKCQSSGDQFKLWAEATALPIRQATIDLCHQLGCDVPWTQRTEKRPSAPHTKNEDRRLPWSLLSRLS